MEIKMRAQWAKHTLCLVWISVLEVGRKTPWGRFLGTMG